MTINAAPYGLSDSYRIVCEISDSCVRFKTCIWRHADLTWPVSQVIQNRINQSVLANHLQYAVNKLGGCDTALPCGLVDPACSTARKMDRYRPAMAVLCLVAKGNAKALEFYPHSFTGADPDAIRDFFRTQTTAGLINRLGFLFLGPPRSSHLVLRRWKFTLPNATGSQFDGKFCH